MGSLVSCYAQEDEESPGTGQVVGVAHGLVWVSAAGPQLQRLPCRVKGVHRELLLLDGEPGNKVPAHGPLCTEQRDLAADAALDPTRATHSLPQQLGMPHNKAWRWTCAAKHDEVMSCKMLVVVRPLMAY